MLTLALLNHYDAIEYSLDLAETSILTAQYVQLDDWVATKISYLCTHLFIVVVPRTRADS
jgi:hypothetical protein